MSSYDEMGQVLTEAANSYKNTIKDTGESIIRKVLQHFFEKCPDVESVTWDQYTPYFNDGDACYFSYNRISAHSFRDSVYHPRKGSSNPIEVELSLVDEFLRRLNDELQVIFGDHSTITATRDEITVVECEHE